MFNVNGIADYLKKNNIDGWLIYDYRGRNNIVSEIFGDKFVTRRCFVLISKEKSVDIICHIIDKDQFINNNIDAELSLYSSWENMEEILKNKLQGYNKLAMEYSPKCSIPNVSIVDAGTIELVKQFVGEIVSSADIFQIALSSWTDTAYESHITACKEVEDIKNLAFNYISENIKNEKNITEYDVQKLIIDEFEKRNMITDDVPIVAVNENSGNPHYMPSVNKFKEIKKGDLVLIDLWAKQKGKANVFGDITWMGYVGDSIPEKYVNIFNIVKGARDEVVVYLKHCWSQNKKVQGWQLDKVARDYITKYGCEKYFIHRTGHSIAPGDVVHGIGVNLDNYETHDTRYITPGVGFSIEPGIYQDEFGVRSEINVFCKENEVVVTTSVQDKILTLL